MLPCLVCSFTTATNRTIRSGEDGATSTIASQSRACDNDFTAYKDLKGRARDLSSEGGVLRDGPLRLLPNLRPPLFRRLDNRCSTSCRQDTLLYTDDFALQMSQCKVNSHWRKREGLLELDSGSG
jgi:hypothetical protein